MFKIFIEKYRFIYVYDAIAGNVMIKDLNVEEKKTKSEKTFYILIQISVFLGLAISLIPIIFNDFFINNPVYKFYVGIILFIVSTPFYALIFATRLNKLNDYKNFNIIDLNNDEAKKLFSLSIKQMLGQFCLRLCIFLCCIVISTIFYFTNLSNWLCVLSFTFAFTWLIFLSQKLNISICFKVLNKVNYMVANNEGNKKFNIALNK